MAQRDVVIKYLGRSRFEPYLEEMDGDKKKALSLYTWGAQLSSSVQQILGITEVILRNSIDAQLQVWNNGELGRETSWLLYPPARPLLSLISKKRIEAIRRARKQAGRRLPTHPRYRESITHDDVLANTMFGLWKDILPNHAKNANQQKQANLNRMRLWNESIAQAFPYLGNDDAGGETTYWRVVHLHELRNRVSHMDSLLHVNVARSIKDAYDLVGSIDPALRDWITGVSEVSATLKRRPSG